MVTVSSAERAAGRLEPSTVKAVIAALTRDGHALLHGALDPGQLDSWAVTLDADAAAAALDPERLTRDRGEGQPFGHIQLGLPRDQTVTANLLSNPFIEQLTEAAIANAVRYHRTLLPPSQPLPLTLVGFLIAIILLRE